MLQVFIAACGTPPRNNTTPLPPSSPPYYAPPWPPSSAVETPAQWPSDGCTQPAGNCWSTLCCSQPVSAPVYGCFKHVDRSFAQCRPLYGWANHTEVLEGTCADDDRWQCPQTWLTDAQPDRQAPATRATAAPLSTSTILRDGYWDYTCTDDYAECTTTECCANPSFGCFKRSGRHFAQCRPLQPHCVDYEWLCPGWEKCAETHSDCTSSLCCRDVGSACHRKPLFYYAQCRDENLACTPWEEWRSVTDPDGFLCPGWEVCSATHEECTLSRCCANPSDACYLNRTSGERSDWYAQCRPRPVHNHTASGGGADADAHYALSEPAGAPLTGPWDIDTAGQMDDAACGGSSEWVCPEKWMEWRDAVLYDYPIVGDHPKSALAAVVLVVVGVLAVCACCCCTNRKKVARAVDVAKGELNEMQIAQQIKSAKGTSEGAGLRDDDL